MVKLDHRDRELKAYRSLLENAQAMLAAAQEGRWDDLIQMDQQRSFCLNQLIEASESIASTQLASSPEKASFIKNILAIDEQTKDLVKSWQSEMAQTLGTMDNSRKLANAYRSG